MSKETPRGILHLDINSKILAIEPAKIIPNPSFESSKFSPQWKLNLLTASF